jgi:hypothetical protein
MARIASLQPPTVRFAGRIERIERDENHLGDSQNQP